MCFLCFKLIYMLQNILNSASPTNPRNQFRTFKLMVSKCPNYGRGRGPNHVWASKLFASIPPLGGGGGQGTLDNVQNSLIPPLGRYGRKKFGRSDLLLNPPSPYRSLDILTVKDWKFKVYFQQISYQSKNWNFLVGLGLVGDAEINKLSWECHTRRYKSS